MRDSYSDPINVTVLLSGGGTTFAAIQAFSQLDQSRFQITKVISDNPNACGLERASDANISTAIVDYKEFDDRKDFDLALLKETIQSKPDLVVLAGFMRIVDSQFVAEFDGKLLNIHPSLLPKYPGLNTYQRAIDAGETLHGSTVHFVNNVLDGGPLIAQVIVNIEDIDSAETLSARVQLGERKLYPTVINWFAERRLIQRSALAYLDDKALDVPLQAQVSNTEELCFERFNHSH